jgi:recombination protein RecT
MTATVQTPGTAVAKREAPAPLSFASPKDARHSLTRLGDVLAPLLPKGVSLDAFTASVYFWMKKTPALAKCSTDSVLEAFQKTAQSGLELGATCYVLPYGGKATFIADYKGIAQKMIASGVVRAVDARVVRAGDRFEYEYGLDEKLVHVVQGDETRAITHAYVVLKLARGEKTFLVMSVGEIDAIRTSKSQSWGKGECPAWYAKKTVVRQIAKTIPDPRLMAALRVVDAVDDDTDDDDTVAPVVAIPATTEPDDAPMVYHGRPGRMVATEPYDDEAAQQQYADEGGA